MNATVKQTKPAHTADWYLSNITEARFKVREAVQMSDLASVIWWENEMRRRQAAYRAAIARAEPHE